ncbi:MAG: signal recognition particle-docking protein FtsY [Anaerolineales bacterium]|nr:signal recognition particle-docking protein FtsY [Anaerolineales bacterium]MDW8161018.1 signal recognition particle-docking protein FtsY [Anaerolineales bacterium]
MINIFSKWKAGLTKTSQAAFTQIKSILAGGDIDPSTYEDIEALLIQADLGVETTQEVIQALKQAQINPNIIKSIDLEKLLRQELSKRLIEPPPLSLEHRPTVILIVGVNGSGKTTTIAKLAHYFRQQGKTVLLGAADTFRAAAIDQLQIWAERLDLPVISGSPGADSGAVAYDTVQASIARKIDVTIIDTAGRLHTRYNLMEELKKVHRVIGKALPGAPHYVWLVLDATTGQNALQQARAFQQAVQVNGVILAKLDSSAKGGMAFAIQKELGVPIYFAGLGETYQDLEPFNPQAFLDGILPVSSS